MCPYTCPDMLHLLMVRQIGLAIRFVGLQPVLGPLLHLRLFFEIFHLRVSAYTETYKDTYKDTSPPERVSRGREGP